MELTMRHLQQRNEILDDGLSSIRSTLIESSRAFSAHQENPNSDNQDSNVFMSASYREPSSNHRRSSSTDTDSNATTYLLSLHESLREEVAQLSHAISDLDARASMALMNETLRLKEEMTLTGAAVNSVRMQVQWLMNPRLHQGQRTQNTNNTGAGPGTGVGGPSNSNSAGLLRPRRLSDTGREGTKL
ncbi:hypothetical protein BDV06DRAFT_136666 [Aspergillus oleicola]